MIEKHLAQIQISMLEKNAGHRIIKKDGFSLNINVHISSVYNLEQFFSYVTQC
jgi:hypothetical protein